MKFKTFRILVTLGVLGAGGATAYVLTRHHDVPGTAFHREPIERPPRPRTYDPLPAPTPAPRFAPSEPPTPPPVAATSVVALRPMDKQILDRVAKGITADKQKDAIPGATFKVDLFKDAGQSAVNRAKVDLNRNGKWDEKWTFEPGGAVKREVAPADDENYTDEYRLDGDHWVPKGAVTAESPPPQGAPVVSSASEPPANTSPVRAFDQQIIQRVAQDISGEKQKDAIPGASFKLDLFKDPGQAHVNRAKLDLNRNGKWDEKWTFPPGGPIKREVAPADDENYTQEYHLDATGWVRKK